MRSLQCKQAVSLLGVRGYAKFRIKEEGYRGVSEFMVCDVTHLILAEDWRRAGDALKDVFQHKSKLGRCHKGSQGLGCQAAHSHGSSEGKLPDHWCKEGGRQLIRLHVTDMSMHGAHTEQAHLQSGIVNFPYIGRCDKHSEYKSAAQARDAAISFCACHNS